MKRSNLILTIGMNAAAATFAAERGYSEYWERAEAELVSRCEKSNRATEISGKQSLDKKQSDPGSKTLTFHIKIDDAEYEVDSPNEAVA